MLISTYPYTFIQSDIYFYFSDISYFLLARLAKIRELFCVGVRLEKDFKSYVHSVAPNWSLHTLHLIRKHTLSADTITTIHYFTIVKWTVLLLIRLRGGSWRSRATRTPPTPMKRQLWSISPLSPVPLCQLTQNIDEHTNLSETLEG